jgi:hypothetical protein
MPSSTKFNTLLSLLFFFLSSPYLFFYFASSLVFFFRIYYSFSLEQKASLAYIACR